MPSVMVGVYEGDGDADDDHDDGVGGNDDDDDNDNDFLAEINKRDVVTKR